MYLTQTHAFKKAIILGMPVSLCFSFLLYLMEMIQAPSQFTRLLETSKRSFVQKSFGINKIVCKMPQPYEQLRIKSEPFGEQDIELPLL
jgi:hypothetical protein